MSQTIEMIDPARGEIIEQQQIAEQLPAQAEEHGVSLVGAAGRAERPLAATHPRRRSVYRAVADSAAEDPAGVSVSDDAVVGPSLAGVEIRDVALPSTFRRSFVTAARKRSHPGP